LLLLLLLLLRGRKFRGRVDSSCYSPIAVSITTATITTFAANVAITTAVIYMAATTVTTASTASTATTATTGSNIVLAGNNGIEAKQRNAELFTYCSSSRPKCFYKITQQQQQQ
jgi:hypothetical protein